MHIDIVYSPKITKYTFLYEEYTVHWIIQDNMYSEEGVEALIQTLERFDIPYTVVTLDSAGIPEPNPIDSTNKDNVIICGTYKLADYSDKNDWKPGCYLNGNHNHRAWVQHWGDRMLNSDAITSSFGLIDVSKMGTRVFIRPAEDNKYFNGQVLDAEEIMDWRDSCIAGQKMPVRCSPKLTKDTLVVCAPYKQVYQECRFFIIDSKIVTGSTYRIGDVVASRAEFDKAALDYAQETIEIWEPAQAYVLDVALTDNGYKVVEVNCINMSGFYGADVQKIVMELEELNNKIQPQHHLPN